MMKNKIYTVKWIAGIFVSFFFFTSYSQTSNSSKHSDQDKLVNTWYESPHQGTDGNTVFLRNKYVPVPGIDRQEDPLIMIVIDSDRTFIKTQYCGYCPERKLEEKKGNYEILQQADNISGLKISFPNETKSDIFKLISCSEDKLVLNFEQDKNTK